MAYIPPVDHRTPRTVAVEQTPAGMFVDSSMDYNAQAGVPSAYVRGSAHDNAGPTFGPVSPFSGEKSPIANLKGSKE